MKLTGAQIVCESPLKEGVKVMFGIPGGVLLPFYDTLPQYPKIHHILCRHEQGAAHAAEGYARACGKVGVCLATSGPGATNLVTGIASAYLDSVPMVAITGQVARPFIGKDAFQEIDITGITLPITKHNYLVASAHELATVVKESFHIASTGRQGPVLIDIPRDVFVEESEYHYPEKADMPGYKPTVRGHPAQIKKAAKFIKESNRPLIIAGNGVIASGASAELKELAEKAQIPVVNTLLGLGSFPGTHVLCLGMLGMHGLAHANMAVSAADLIIAIGMRFDDRATASVAGFAPKAQVIHIDVDPAEIGKNVKVDVPIVGDVKHVLKALNAQIEAQNHVEWISQIQEWEREHPPLSIRECESVLPQYVINQIYEVTNGDAIIVTGVGQNQMFASHYFKYDRPNQFLSSGGLGPMGFELPGAMGAKVACPDEAVWCVAGDGGFQMTIQELATIVQEKLAVKIAILNNGYLGMVRQWQELFYGRRYSQSSLHNPDFANLARAFGAVGITCDKKEQVPAAIEQMLKETRPVVADFRVDPEENVWPMVAAGKALDEMDGLELLERLA
ncbi:MAG: biosynthetic-type acetolactate synthase large subunit [Spirochaetales bacterium]|nr:MAG: biosynthetic-type acetolactate synthase large subunit [Spirochaetales bacterium]